MKFPRIEFRSTEWALEIWGETRVLYLKLCRSWDGRFIVDHDRPVLPLWGYRREDFTQKLDQHTLKPRTRTVRSWRLWWPFCMVWYMHNERDVVEITVAGDTDSVH